MSLVSFAQLVDDTKKVHVVENKRKVSTPETVHPTLDDLIS